MIALPAYIEPDELAQHLGWSPRRLRDFARKLGACRILGNRMVLTKSDVDAIMEASRPCPSNSTAATTARSGTTGAPLPGGDYEALLARRKRSPQRFIAELETRQWKGHFDGPESVLTFAQAAILYRDAEKATRFLDRVEDYWKDKPVKSITGGAVRKGAIVTYPDAVGATRNRQFIVPTVAIINHAASLDLCRHLKVDRFPVIKKEKEPATWEWVQAFMAVSTPHLGALAAFMFLTGARITEAINLRWGDVDLTARRALIKQTKISEERKAHLPPALVAALANIPSNREPDVKVFGYSTRDTAKHPWFAACKRAKIKVLTFHSCRHGFATALLHRRIDPITVAKLGGWKSPQHVFQTYGHAMDDDTLEKESAESIVKSEC